MHQCVRCGKIYEDGSNQILKGCSSCNGRFFFFVKKDALKKVQEITQKLSKEDKIKVEEDVKDIIGLLDEDVPIILDLASVNVLEPGKFQLDIIKLFKGDPLVYKLEDGKYIIDIAATFMQTKNEN